VINVRASEMQLRQGSPGRSHPAFLPLRVREAVTAAGLLGRVCAVVGVLRCQISVRVDLDLRRLPGRLKQVRERDCAFGVTKHENLLRMMATWLRALYQ
jgi:hypothetical protein